MKLPSALSSLESLVPLNQQGGLIYFRLTGHCGWTVEHTNGLLVAMAVECDEPDDAWFEQIALWLASTPAGLDDSLQIAEEAIWLVRRHTLTIEAVELESSLTQLISIARWLAKFGETSSEVGSSFTSEKPV